MILRIPPTLPIVGRNKGLHVWLNRLREAVIASQMHLPHNVKKIQGPQGVNLEGGLGGENTTESSTNVPRWG